MDSLVSVIIPVYNVESYLELCITSVINQTYQNLQIILIDDGSTDRSGELCNKFAQMDRRILTIHQKNKGVSKARNEGLKNAKGDYIGFVDPDDWCEPDMFGSMVKAIEETNVDAARCNYRVVYDTHTELYATQPVRRIVTAREALIDMDLHHITQERGYGEVIWNTLFKTDIIKKPEMSWFNPDIHMGEDTDMARRLFLKCKSILLLPDCCYNYNRRNINSKMRKVTNLEWVDYYTRKLSFFYENQFPKINIISAQKSKRDSLVSLELAAYVSNDSKDVKTIDELPIVSDALSRGRLTFSVLKRMIVLIMIKLRMPPKLVKIVWNLHR